MGEYLLGVDGGSAKTEYALYTAGGDFVDFLIAGTCSHDEAAGGFDGMEYAMIRHLTKLLTRNNLDVQDIAAAGLGLFGANLQWQLLELSGRLSKIGLGLFDVHSRAMLGIKAAFQGGVGLCAVNGSGAAVAGFDESGNSFQLGGLGPMSGDLAGGEHIFAKIVSALYDFHFRMGEDSAMFEGLMRLYSCKPHSLPNLIGDGKIREKMPEAIQIACGAAKQADIVACEIFDSAGRELGRSAAGCIRKLAFYERGTLKNPIGIALLGSIWEKVGYIGMVDAMVDTAVALGGKDCEAALLDTSPAVGGVFWAKELLDGRPPSAEFRKKAKGAFARKVT